MNIPAFVQKITAKYATGNATEHSYRPALEELFDSIGDKINAINEPTQSRNRAAGQFRSQNLCGDKGEGGADRPHSQPLP